MLHFLIERDINKEKCYNTTFFRINPDYHVITDSNLNHH